MKLKPDTSHILMSETLKDQLPEGEVDDPLAQFSGTAVYVVADRCIGGQRAPLTGLLRSVLFGAEPEIKIMVELSEALATVNAENMQILGIELQHGQETTIPIPGPFVVKAACIDNIDVVQQSCILSLQLLRVKKT